MPTIKDKLHFNFGGISSKTYGLINIVTDNGMYTETLIADRSLNETKVRGSKKPMLHSIEDSPLEFDMTIAFEQSYTDEIINNVIKWLFVDYYRPLYFEGKENRVFMAIAVGSPQIIHNGLNQGYVELTMRCNSSSVFSPHAVTPLTTVTTSSTITVVSDSHFDVYPEISFKKIGIGHVNITSLDDGGNIFEVRNLTNQEDIYIHCGKEIIETDLMGTYRYGNIIGEFPRLVQGTNRFKVTGGCAIQLRYKNEYRF